jgi:sulfide:quinone oxidoreductase
MAHVVILGGGFGGLAAAHRLRSLLPEDDDITLVDHQDRFYMGFAKLWDLARVRPLENGTVRLSRLAARGVRFRQTSVTAIDPATRRVDTTDGRIHSDGLIVALGAGPSPAHRELLAGESSHDLYDAAALPAMHAALDSIDSGRVLVSILGAPFKCPPAPFEAVLVVDERLRRRGVRDRVEVAISTPQPMTLPVAGSDASRYLADRLGDRSIELVPGRAVAGVDHARQVVRFDGHDDIEFALLLGVPASVPPPVVRDSDLSDDTGWVRPDLRTFRAGHERVYAVGDCTVVPNATGQLPKAGVFAAAEGDVAARNLAVDLHGGEEAVFDGHGYCFLELPGRRVAYVEGDFLAEPRPDVRITEADEERFRRKQAYERDRLTDWLG